MKKDKIVIGGLVIVLLFIFINIASTINTILDYEKNKKSGNYRWFQVENRILQTEEKVNNLEKEIRDGGFIK